MAITVRRTSGYSHVISIGEHTLAVDEPADKGGADTGPTPRQLLLSAMASCVAITLEIYAERKGWHVGDVEVTAQEPERGTVEIEIELEAELDDEQRERLLSVAGRCPVVSAVRSGMIVNESLRA